MNKKFLTLLSCTSLLLQASPQDADRGSCCPTNTFQNLVVANNITAGSETVRGAVTAASFVLSSGDTLFNGLRNWAVLTNDAAVTSADNVLWAATVPLTGNTSPGISFNPATGIITLPTSPSGTGLFLIQYTVRFTAGASETAAKGTAQLFQGPAAGPVTVPITQPAIVSSTETTVAATSTQPQVTGFALVRASSALNNGIALNITLANGMTLPVATSPDANAEMTILQLN
jgi:hypothetical protein